MRWPTAQDAGHKVVFWADSRRRIKRFRNVIIKPNQFEAVGLENPMPGQQVDAAAALRGNPPIEEYRRGADLRDLRSRRACWSAIPS